MNLIERIAYEMESDTDNLASQSDRLRAAYDTADDAGKALIDDVLICVCGYSVPSLLKMVAADDEDEGEGPTWDSEV